MSRDLAQEGMGHESDWSSMTLRTVGSTKAGGYPLKSFLSYAHFLHAYYPQPTPWET
jgi:hypothetical protein